MTSGTAGSPGGRHRAGPGTSPETGQSPESAPDPGVPQADAETGPPDDMEELQQEIEQTREQLGETVEQLVAKADVKARAREKATELAGRVKGTAGRARTQAAAGAGKVRDQLAGKTGPAHQQTVLLDTPAAGQQVSGPAAGTATPVWGAVPEPVRQAVTKGAGRARQHPAPLAVAAGVLVAGFLVVRWWRRR